MCGARVRGFLNLFHRHSTMEMEDGSLKQDMIVILDLGSTENARVARAVRALGVYSEIYPHDTSLEKLRELPNV